MEATVDPLLGGPDWMPITPKRGSLFHAETQLAHAFGIDINKDIVRRVLAKHYRPEAGTDGRPG
jgi:hypothetical protein